MPRLGAVAKPLLLEFRNAVPANTSIIFPAVSDQMPQKPSLLANANISTQSTQYQCAVVGVGYPNSC